MKIDEFNDLKKVIKYAMSFLTEEFLLLNRILRNYNLK